jgi:hypothetical protein
VLEPMKGASQWNINSFSFALSARYEKFFKRSVGPFQVIRDLMASVYGSLGPGNSTPLSQLHPSAYTPRQAACPTRL